MTNKEKLAIPPQEMPVRAPGARRRDMREVALGYSAGQAMAEASRCLGCKNAPCVAGCPVHVRIPEFLSAAARGDFAGAIGVIRESSLLPAICGRVCPQESQCQRNCTLGKVLGDAGKAVAIGRVERFCADFQRARGPRPRPAAKASTGKRVAVVGSGPAGLTVAADVRREGHDVTVFEALHVAGGVLVYGIPGFRLPKDIVRDEIDGLKAMGVKFETDFLVGRTRRVADFLGDGGFDAVFIGVGAGLPRFMGIPGEDLVGVYSANEYLTRANLMKAYDRARAHTPAPVSRKVAVLGGGNVAMDAARMALRLGAEESHIVYRRTENEMPARREEVLHAREEGVVFHMLANAKAIVGDGDGRAKAVECAVCELGAPDSSGRRAPVEKPGAALSVEADTVVVAIGNGSNPLVGRTTRGLELDKRGNIVVDENLETSIDGVYAGGDAVLGAATVILAMGEGRAAAAAINRRLAGAPRRTEAR